MHPAIITALVLAAANHDRNFHIGPWIIVPILVVVAVVGAVVYVVRGRRARSRGPTQ
jgi:hypothetical protein